MFAPMLVCFAVSLSPEPRMCAPTLAEKLCSLPPTGAQFAARGGPSPRMCAPTLAEKLCSLPPTGAQFAARGGPSPRMCAPTLAEKLCLLPPTGAQFAARGGPSPLMRRSALTLCVGRRHRRRRYAAAGRRGLRLKLAPLVGGQVLVFLPPLTHFVLLVRRQLAQVLVLLARRLPLLGREL